MAFNTGNPVPSTDARDLSDNAESIDQITNGTSTVITRTGKVVKSIGPLVDAVDASATQGLIDIAADVSNVDASATQAEIDILTRLNEVGVIYDSPIRPWSASLLVEDLRAHEYNGDIYIPTKALPFTTGATFNTSDWMLLQGITNGDIANNISIVKVHQNVAAFKADTTEYPDGKIIRLLDRKAEYIKITGVSSDNGENIIKSDQTSSSLQLIEDIIEISGDGTTYTSGDVIPSTSTKVIFSANCMQEPTLNGKALKVLDIYQTEQAQWTIVNGGDATKDITKVIQYRSVSRGMISEDVPYTLRYESLGDFYIIAIKRLYKHVFLKCGNGAEITELQDAFGYLSQFDKGTHMDTEFMRSDVSTEFFPNKAQISVVLPAGPDENTPIISNMSKPIRIGENGLNGIEIINDTRYFTNLKYGACVVNFTGALGSDDLAVINIWKSDLGEVKGITWRYHGEFNFANQAVVRYNRSVARFKDCAIDVSAATFSGSPAAVVGIYFDRQVETFGCKFIGPTTAQDMTAVSMYSTIFGGWEITGRPENAFAVRGQCLLTSDIVVSGIVQNVFAPFGESSVYIAGAGSLLNGVNLYDAGSIPFSIHVDSNVTLTPAAWQYYKGKTIQANTTLWVEDSATPQITANSTSGGAASFAIAHNGVVDAKAGNIASVTGFEISGDGTTRHLKIEPTGGARLYSGDGTTNGILTVVGSNLFWNGTQLN